MCCVASWTAFRFCSLMESPSRVILSNYACGSPIANNQRPAKVHDLPQLVKKVYERKCDPSLQPAIMVLMFSIKNACRSGWFQQSDTDALLSLSDEISSRFTSKGNYTTDVNNVLPLITQVMSRFCPHLRVCHVIVSVEAKPGYNVLVTDFYIPRTLWTNSHGRICLFVSQVENLETSSCITSPPQVNFLINGQGVEGRNKVSMEPGPQLPSDITGLLKVGINLLQAIGKFTGSYIIAIAVMATASTPDATLLKEYAQPAVSMLSSDDEIIEGPSRISLNCPISFQRIGTPVKGQNCKHIQCFDYNNFMEINSRKPYWRCPHCNQPTCWSDLRIDQNMLKVLTEVGRDVSDVLFSNDGSWKPCVEKDAHSDLLPPHSPQFSSNSSGVVDLTIETESVVVNGTGLENLNEKTIQYVCTNSNGLEAVDRKPSQEILDSLVHTEIHSGTSYVHPSAESIQSPDEQIMRDIWLRATSSNYASNGSAVPAASLAASTVPQPNPTYSSGNLVSMPADAVGIMPTRQLVDTPGVYQPTLYPLQSISPGIQVAAEDSSVHHPWIIGNAITEPRRSLIPRNVTRSPLAVQALPAQGQLQTALSRARSTLNANSTVANGPAAPSTGPLMTANPDVGTMEMEQHQLLRPQNNLLGGLEVSSSPVPVWSNSQERQHHPNQPLQSVAGRPTMSQAGLRNTLEQQRTGVPPTQLSSFKDQQSVQCQPNLRVPQTNRQSETIVRQVPTFPPLPVHQSTQPTMGLATSSGTLLAMHPTTNQQNILRRNGMANAIPASSHVTRPTLSSGLSIPMSIDNSRLSMDQQWSSPIASVPMCGATIPDMASEQDWRAARRMRGSISLSSVSGRINPGLVSHYPMQQYHGLQGQPRPSTVSSQLPTVIGNHLMAQRSESHARTGNPAPMM
ncbi:E4 SUMO-protein ligase PIAL2-like isoform X2 [Nymphaea colorata]|uniref:E4 SUMO-protein ligase PIAL2-like isoform X2 n=1 Tax=Nymphaea colorata TaxID=210225 RepID=UPI00129D3277|nr:E4 SUMO-protein ligase PIAL2-like isoform X2 [Nymphaea colorata]